MSDSVLIHNVSLLLSPEGTPTEITCTDSQAKATTTLEIEIRRPMIAGTKQRMRFTIADPPAVKGQYRYFQAFSTRDLARLTPWSFASNLQTSPEFEFGQYVEVLVVVLADPFADPPQAQAPRLLKRRFKIVYEGGGDRALTDEG